jgi:hypothetical protein
MSPWLKIQRHIGTHGLSLLLMKSDPTKTIPLVNAGGDYTRNGGGFKGKRAVKSLRSSVGGRVYFNLDGHRIYGLDANDLQRGWWNYCDARVDVADEEGVYGGATILYVVGAVSKAYSPVIFGDKVAVYAGHRKGRGKDLPPDPDSNAPAGFHWRLEIYDLQSGRRLWREPQTRNAPARLVSVGNHFFALASDTLTAYR